MIKIYEVIVVEGRYDKNTLSQFLDATIIETRGFGIFSDNERMQLLKTLAEKRGLIVLTDSDGAGFLIRNRIKGAIDSTYVKHAYIPDVPGKERRKDSPSKEGMLGVEGMSREIIIKALQSAGVQLSETDDDLPRGEISKADLFELGLSGAKDSAARRLALQEGLGLPKKLTTNALLEVLNILMGREALFAFFDE